MTPTSCRVCGEPTTEHSHAECLRCQQPFHLALRQDVPAKDCGAVWLSEETMTLDFACAICLAPERGEPSPAPTAVAVGPAAAAPAAPPAKAGPRRYARRTGVRATDVVRQKQARGR